MLAVAAGGAPVLRKLVAVSAVTDPTPPEAPGLRIPFGCSGGRGRVRLISHSHSATKVLRPGDEFRWCGRVAGGGGGGDCGRVGGDRGIGSEGRFDVSWSWKEGFSGFEGFVVEGRRRCRVGCAIGFEFFGIFR